MNEIIACPSCQRKVTVPTAFFGKLVQCPQCQHTFIAVDPSDAVQPAAPPSVRLAAVEMDAWDEPAPILAARRRHRFEADSRDDLALHRPTIPHRGPAVLTLGILSLLPICAPVLGPIAWIMGHTDLKLIRSGQMDRSGEGTTQAGMILGIVTTIIAAAILSLFCLAGLLDSMRHF